MYFRKKLDIYLIKYIKLLLRFFLHKKTSASSSFK